MAAAASESMSEKWTVVEGVEMDTNVVVMAEAAARQSHSGDGAENENDLQGA